MQPLDPIGGNPRPAPNPFLTVPMSLLAAFCLFSCDRQDKGAANLTSALAAAVDDGSLSGLDFPSNGQSSSEIRFNFTGTNLPPMYPATYVWRANLRQQTGYYGLFYWGPNGPFYGVNYYGPRPYPDGTNKSTSNTHKWSIAANGEDPVTDAFGHSTQLGYDAWRIQAFRAYDNGVNKVHELPSAPPLAIPIPSASAASSGASRSTRPPCPCPIYFPNPTTPWPPRRAAPTSGT
jgi:hypothetical protein